MNDYFEGMIGQEGAKKELSFRIDRHLENGAPFPNLLLTGQKGDGKTLLAKKIGKNLPDRSEPDRKYKRFFTVNGSDIQSPAYFFEEVIDGIQAESEYSTIFIDEAHELPKKVQSAMLNPLETSKNHLNRYTFRGRERIFDFTKMTFIMATTEDDRIFHALKDRFHTINLEMYQKNELGEIIKKLLNDSCQFEEEAIEFISHFVRRNARFADRIATDIRSLGKPIFRVNHAESLIDQLNLLPHGLEKIELHLLKTLRDCGPLSLSELSCRIGRPPEATRKSIEPYLISLGLMTIDGKRKISQPGRDLLKIVGK